MTARAATIPDLDLARIRRSVAARIPAKLAAEVRLELEIRGAVVTIVERRAPWRADYGPEWSRLPIAQLRYDPAASTWSLHWSRATGRWQRYDRLAPTSSIDRLLAELHADPASVFWG